MISGSYGPAGRRSCASGSSRQIGAREKPFGLNRLCLNRSISTRFCGISIDASGRREYTSSTGMRHAPWAAWGGFDKQAVVGGEASPRRDGGPNSDSEALEVPEPLSSPGWLGFVSEGVLRSTRPSWAQPARSRPPRLSASAFRPSGWGTGCTCVPKTRPTEQTPGKPAETKPDSGTSEARGSDGRPTG